MDRLKNYIAANPSVLPVSLVFLIFIFLLVFMGLQITSKPVRLFGKAADSGAVDPGNSTIWSDKYSLKVGEAASVKVFLYNADNRAVGGKKAVLNLTPAEIVEKNVLEETTDSNGQANFSITAKGPGTVKVSVIGEGVSLSKGLDLVFVK